jgi:NADH-quinone oxidoreductase subunit N
MDWSTSLRLIAPEELLGIASLVLLLIAAWGGDRASRAVSLLSVAALAGAGFLAALALGGGMAGADSHAFFDQFRADAFAAFAKLLIYVGAIGAVIVAPAFFERYRAMRAEYPLLILLAALGGSIMVSASDLITLYIGVELNSLASYVLASFLRTDDRSAEAGLKYFVLGALASGILLYGMSLTYGFTGSTSFAGIHAALAGGLSTGALFGVVFVLAGLAFKIAAVPFHMWTPDVYEGAPTPVTTFFATAPKVAGMALTMRVTLDAFGAESDAWRQIVIFASLASILWGAFGAIGQANIKRLMAYSSINHVGFILIGLACATPVGASAMLVYLVIYLVMVLGTFVAILMLRGADGEHFEAIADMAGLAHTRPWLALALGIAMFSLAGIPPLFGFWGKFVVFQAAVQAGLIPLAVIGIAASVISAFYYLKVVKVMYIDEPADKVVGRSDWAHGALLTLTAVFMSPLGYLLTKWLGGLADTAATALFHAV